MRTDIRDEWFAGLGLDSIRLDLRQRLAGDVVELRVHPSAAALGLALVNLVARVVPGVRVIDSDVRVDEPVFGPAGLIRDVADGLAAAVASDEPSANGSLRVLIDVGAGLPNADFYVSADAWSLRLSRRPHPVLVGRGPAVTAAAAIAASQIILVLLPELAGSRLRRTDLFEWNLVDYGRRVHPRTLEMSATHATVFGAGSVGSATIYSLLLARATGHIDIVDSDKLSARNRLRYVLWIADASGPKATWAASLSHGTGLAVTPHTMSSA